MEMEGNRSTGGGCVRAGGAGDAGDAGGEALSLLELADVDEEVVQERLSSLMRRGTHSALQLRRALLLLRYKLLVNAQDGTGCDNRRELAFALRLLDPAPGGQASPGSPAGERSSLAQDILRAALLLDEETLPAHAEHLLQQLLARLMNDPTLDRLMFAEAVLDATLTARLRIVLPLDEKSVASLLRSDSTEVRNRFVGVTVGKIIAAVGGLNVLDQIWNTVAVCDEKYLSVDLSAMCSLSEYYLPIPDVNGAAKYESAVILDHKFWLLVLRGMRSEDATIRKYALYLAKRAIDCASRSKKNISILTSEDLKPIFVWNAQNKNMLDDAWKYFFVLIETLNEKQSNIVQAALALFDKIEPLNDRWQNCAFDLALKHENHTVVQMSLEYRLKKRVVSVAEVETLLNALNNSCMYDGSREYQQTFNLLVEFCSNISNLHWILKAFNKIKWSAVPLFYMTEIFANLEFKPNVFGKDIIENLSEISEKPCNNVLIRKAVRYNILQFVMKNYNTIQCFIQFLNNCKEGIDSSLLLSQADHLRIQHIFESSENKDFDTLDTVTKSYLNIEVLLLFLKQADKLNSYINHLERMINDIKNVNSRHYARKDNFDKEFVHICCLLKEIRSYKNIEEESIYNFLFNKIDCLIVYLLNLMSTSDEMEISRIDFYMRHSSILFNFTTQYQNLLEELVKTAQRSLIEGQSEDYLLQKYFCAKVISTALSQCRREALNVLKILEIKDAIYEISSRKESMNGKLKNKLNEANCELIYYISMSNERLTEENIETLLSFINKMLDSGGYGCLLWILRTITAILPQICNNESQNYFTLTKFFERSWNEIEELKSNDQYKPCIREFVGILLHPDVLNKVSFNDVMAYCMKIVLYGSVSNVPLYFVAHEIYLTPNLESLPIITVLTEILLFGAVPRKDQRIFDATMKHIRNTIPSLFVVSTDSCHNDSEIRNKAVMTLFKIKSTDVLDFVVLRIKCRIDELYKNKRRYHGNSHPHRILLRGLQNMLLILLLRPEGDHLQESVQWCVNLLSKLPHQPSVRICLEWYISLYVIIRDLPLSETLDKLNLKLIPPTSTFMILYLVLKCRIKCEINTHKEDYATVMDYLLSHTMGQLFNTRLHAQYLSLCLYRTAPSEEYCTTCKIIENTFKESGTEKSYLKLKSNFFVNDFDIIECLAPRFIYHFLPKCTSVGDDEIADYVSIPSVKECATYISNKTNSNNLWKYWRNLEDIDADLSAPSHENESREDDECNDAGTIQKKYIPWNNMLNGAEFSSIVPKMVKPSGLIVVASLVDKLPNLGGLARTSEVFGVKKYIIDSLRHVQDKQFQDVSVSAERWVDIEEVRPGRALKEYLQRMKCEGYTVVAAEQTSSSVSLETYKFPLDTVLVLGHEKEGVPADILPLMDQCIEIPQRGYVRSLNVHVTAAIFVWEYIRQNLL